jgi:hypothetical protein
VLIIAILEYSGMAALGLLLGWGLYFLGDFIKVRPSPNLIWVIMICAIAYVLLILLLNVIFLEIIKYKIGTSSMAIILLFGLMGLWIGLRGQDKVFSSVETAAEIDRPARIGTIAKTTSTMALARTRKFINLKNIRHLFSISLAFAGLYLGLHRAYTEGEKFATSIEQLDHWWLVGYSLPWVLTGVIIGSILDWILMRMLSSESDL